MPDFAAVPVLENLDRARFDAEVRFGGRPVILKGVAASWPLVKTAQTSIQALGDYLQGVDAGRSIPFSISPKEQDGRFFYNDDLSGLTFDTRKGTLSQLVNWCLANQARDGQPGAEAAYLQAAPVDYVAPQLLAGLSMPLLNQVPPRLWIGNTLQTATHFDYASNIAVHIAGKKTFTLFPPAQSHNLYPGPLDRTPAGVPVSMVRFDAPDFATYPRYAEALEHALVAHLEPGDGLFIPSLWWHHVDTRGPLNVLINYWWDDTRTPLKLTSLAVLQTAVLAFQSMPEAQRAAWRELFDVFVFREHGDPAAHLPEPVRGLFADPPDAYTVDMLLQQIRRSS